MTFREDTLWNRAGHSAENLSRIRRLAFNLLRRDKIRQVGAKGKRLKAAIGESWPTPVAWESSCDARIYHHKNCPTAIFGAGRLDVAHGPDECVDLADLQKGLAISTLATWAMVQ